MNLGEKYLMVLSRGPTREQIEQVEQSSGGEAMNFRFLRVNRIWHVWSWRLSKVWKNILIRDVQG